MYLLTCPSKQNFQHFISSVFLDRVLQRFDLELHKDNYKRFACSSVYINLDFWTTTCRTTFKPYWSKIFKIKLRTTRGLNFKNSAIFKRPF